MTDRERVSAAILFQDPDPVPCTCRLTGQMADRLFHYPGGLEAWKRFHSPVYEVSLELPQQSLRPGYDRDGFGVVWNKTGADKDIGVIDHILIPDPESLNNYSFPPVDEAFIRRTLEDLQQVKGDRFTVVRLGFSLFERAWTLYGMQNLLCDMVAEPEFVDELLDHICDWNLHVLDIALTYDFDAFYFGDDWGQQKGLIMGPPHWRRFIKPRLARMYRKVREAGRFVIQHSCGDIHEILEDVIELGLNVYQTFQPEIYDLRQYRDLLKGRLAIWGGISTQKELPFLSPKQIREITSERIQMFREGGMILAPTHDVPGDVPPENLISMLDTMSDFQSVFE